MSKRSDSTRLVRQLAEGPAKKLGLDIIAVELNRQEGRSILRLVVDKRGGVSLDDCSELSQLVDPLIDSQTNLGHDFFEVSSPGLDRPLKTEQDYARYEGEQVELRLYQPRDGARKHKGKLAPCSKGEVSIEREDGSLLTVRQEEVAVLKRTVQI